MALRVSISYSTEDRSTVDFVASILASPSVELYVADYSLPAGAPLSDSVVSAIRACDLFIVLWSANSYSSHWVSQEIGVARGANKQIIPVVLYPNLKPSGFIANLKYLDVPPSPEAAFTWLRDNVIARATETVGVFKIVLSSGPTKPSRCTARFGKGFFIPATSMLLPYQRREDVAEA